MDRSATPRERRRLDTEHRITVCAQRLTDAHGLDGFTMDDLAEAAEVSRRTLFNYFPSKIDAVLGNPPDVTPAALAAFVAGGPHAHLAEDLGELAAVLLGSKLLTRAEMELGRRVVTTTPRLIMAAHQRFEQLTVEFVDVILAREGEEFGRDRALLLIRLFVTIFDGCMSDGGDGPELDGSSADVSLADAFRRQLGAARDLLA